MAETPSVHDLAVKNLHTVFATQYNMYLKNNAQHKVSVQLKEGDSYWWKAPLANLVKSKLT